MQGKRLPGTITGFEDAAITRCVYTRPAVCYVREWNVLSLEEAVKKTSARFGKRPARSRQRRDAGRNERRLPELPRRAQLRY